VIEGRPSLLLARPILPQAQLWTHTLRLKNRDLRGSNLPDSRVQMAHALLLQALARLLRMRFVQPA